jgi:hypothetical protein
MTPEESVKMNRRELFAWIGGFGTGIGTGAVTGYLDGRVAELSSDPGKRAVAQKIDDIESSDIVFFSGLGLTASGLVVKELPIKKELFLAVTGFISGASLGNRFGYLSSKGRLQQQMQEGIRSLPERIESVFNLF